MSVWFVYLHHFYRHYLFHKKNLVLQHLINRYMTFISEKFLRRKDIVESKFLISVNYSFIHLISSCCEHITGGLNINFYECVSLLAPESVMCLCVCLRVRSNQNAIKKPHCVSDLSKLDALLHKTHIKVILVLRYQILSCRDP